MLKSKIETQLNMFSYFVVIDLTDKLFFSIDRNSLIELSISNILVLLAFVHRLNTGKPARFITESTSLKQFKSITPFLGFQ